MNPKHAISYRNAQFFRDNTKAYRDSMTLRLSMDTSHLLKALCIPIASAP